jgi:phosphate transport system substrate-binding protein
MAALIGACTASSTGASDPEPTVLGTTTASVLGSTTETVAESDLSLSGTIRITGSSTVEVITRAVSDGYAQRQPDVTVEIEAVGTGAGLQDLCGDPEVRIVGASRPINGQESASCLANGVLPVELRLARDGIAVVANRASALQCLTFVDLYALAGPESTGVLKLQDVATLAAEIGSSTDWGQGPVGLVAPGPVHGTHQLFMDVVVAPIAGSQGVGSFMRADYRGLDSNAQIVGAVAADPAAIGIVGSAYAVRNSDQIRLVGVSDGSGCVLPNDAAVEQGIYPIARDLYLYADGASEDPIVDDFVSYYVNVALNSAVTQSDFVPLSSAEQGETVTRWQAR